jgi:hypothetical protein
VIVAFSSFTGPLLETAPFALDAGAPVDAADDVDRETIDQRGIQDGLRPRRRSGMTRFGRSQGIGRRRQRRHRTRGCLGANAGAGFRRGSRRLPIRSWGSISYCTPPDDRYRHGRGLRREGNIIAAAIAAD